MESSLFRYNSSRGSFGTESSEENLGTASPDNNTGGPDVVFDFGDYVMSSADKTMYENTLNIALNRTY